MDVDKLKTMAALEATYAGTRAKLNDRELAAYDNVMATSAVPSPVRKAGKKLAQHGAKKQFNKSVKQHFSSGRQLSSAHKKAISEGLKRWHSAHGRGNYTAAHRKSAINHINKHLQARVQHHEDMHGHHKAMARNIARGHNGGKGVFHKKYGSKINGRNRDQHLALAKKHLQKANHLKRAILPLTKIK